MQNINNYYLNYSVLHKLLLKMNLVVQLIAKSQYILIMILLQKKLKIISELLKIRAKPRIKL